MSHNSQPPGSLERILPLIATLRQHFHQQLIESKVLTVSNEGIASNADRGQQFSRTVALQIADELNAPHGTSKVSGQQAGRNFEAAVEHFLSAAFGQLEHLRPGKWNIYNFGSSRSSYHLGRYEPYRHLNQLADLTRNNPALAAALGNSYDIAPDVVVLRFPVSDSEINKNAPLVGAGSEARLTPLREDNQRHQIVHAVISCKWTLRSDRAQNARSEALGIIRNRKGRTPHIVVVTGEPSPSRIASLALGTGDIDTVYHFALDELIRAVESSENSEATMMLHTLIDGNRLRDISDLPFDLAV